MVASISVPQAGDLVLCAYEQPRSCECVGVEMTRSLCHPLSSRPLFPPVPLVTGRARQEHSSAWVPEKQLFS